MQYRESYVKGQEIDLEFSADISMLTSLRAKQVVFGMMPICHHLTSVAWLVFYSLNLWTNFN